MRPFRQIFAILPMLICMNLSAQQNRSASGPQNLSGKENGESVRFENPQQIESMLDRYQERFAIMDSIVFRQQPEAVPEYAVDSAAMDFVVSERVEAIDEAVNAQIAAFKAKTGVELRGQTYVRPGNMIGYDPDDPMIAYNAKIQAELVWNIFHSSIYKRASKIRELEIGGELRQLQYEREALDETVYLQQMSVRYRYYGRLLTVLRLHSENLRLLMETQVYLLQNGKISSDDLLKMINEQAEIERQLIAIKADSVVTELPAVPSVAYISVTDTAALMTCIRSEHRDLRKLGLQEELLEVQRKNIDYLQTMNITPFARYSWYNRQNTRNTYNIDVGVSFGFPISFETSRKRKALFAEKNVLRYEKEQIVGDIGREVMEVLHDLKNYNENIYGEYERMASLKRYLVMRTDSYGNVVGEYSRIDRLQEYNAYLQAWERMLAYAYQRDCELIRLQSYIMEEPVSKYLTFQELK